MGNEMKILQFNVGLYRAPNIFVTYLLASDAADRLVAKITAEAEREHSLGELEGKHSNTRRTGREILSGMTVVEGEEQVKAFATLYPNANSCVVWNPDSSAAVEKGKWVGSKNLLEVLEESWY